MATTNQVNIINISNLPETQQVFNGNYFIVQNDLGTQVVDYANLGVLYLDINGNGSYTGTLTGTGIDVSTAVIANVSGSAYYSNGVQGQSYSQGYYNNFQVTNGILTSATYILGSPEYIDITTNKIPNITAALLSAYQATYTSYRTINSWTSTTNNGVNGTYASITFDPFPLGTSTSNVHSNDVRLAQDGSVSSTYELSSVPFVYQISNNNGSPQVTIFVPQTLTQQYIAKLQFDYTA